MTEFLETVAALLEARIDSKSFCNPENTDTQGWKANIHEVDGGKGDPAELRRHLLAAGLSDPIDEPGGRPRKISGAWDLTDCDGTHFPYQSHHLVPKKQLSKHPVRFWLIKNSGQSHDKYKLAADTNYDTDHEGNGYFMPFASTTHQWQTMSAKHTEVCYEMMRRTRRQLHQGGHSEEDYLEGDEENVEHAGYKRMVKQLLNVIDERTDTHVETCDVCKSKGTPAEVQPLEAVVRHMYRVAGMLKGLLRLNKIFVSRRAADYFTKYQKGGRLVPPTTPLV
jgi:A nuclease family of the HNH/ENDO VII superfamily with conserved AHH